MIKMKLFKRLGLFILALCSACFACVFASCEKSENVDETGIVREFSEEEEKKLCAIFSESEYTNDPVDSVVYFYGNYHNTYVACMGKGQSMAIETEEVDGIKFVYPCPIYIFAFRDNKIYTMQEAVDKNYLSHSDIEDIHAISLEQELAINLE